jgi:CRP-like cAMP-binding protein
MKNVKTLSETDLEKLGRLKIFSWLSPAEIKIWKDPSKCKIFRRHEVVFRESEANPSEVHVLITGIARITCLNGRDERVTVALIAPGPIPKFPALSDNRYDFRCESYNNCRGGIMGWNSFESVTANGRESAFKKFHQNDLKYWYRLFLRSSGLLSLDLHVRVAITMLDLCDDFGIEDARGTLLEVPFSHKDIANTVGASRPRVTEQSARLERDHYLFRQGRQFIVNKGTLARSLAENSAMSAHATRSTLAA